MEQEGETDERQLFPEILHYLVIIVIQRCVGLTPFKDQKMET